MTSASERRSHPRAAICIDFNIDGGDHLLTGSTENISPKGLCCELSHHIPLFTKLEMCLMVPDPKDESHEEMDAVRCEGAVVRVDKIDSEPEPVYKTAVFFTHIDESGSEKLNNYIQYHSNLDEY